MKVLKKIKVEIVNGFVDNDKGGNPAGVVFDADNLTDEDKQQIATRVGLAETAFISSSAIADYKLDFFTPSKRIAHCGHATIAGFSYMKQYGQISKEISSKETVDGIRKILLQGDNAYMEQLAPAYIPVDADMDKILLSLGIKHSDLIDAAMPLVVNTGNSFLLVGLKEKNTLKNLQIDAALISAISEKYGLIGYYVFALETVIAGRDATARMFGPFYGIPEESGTGMAAGPLACYLYDKMGLRKKQFLIEQGWFMQTPSPSLIHVDLDIPDNKITRLMAGGKGIAMRTIEFEI